MKRNPDIIFGGFWAFSGGKFEDQDLFDNWEEKYPEMFEHLHKTYYDFPARICAIWETFEEINMLIVKPLDHNSKFKHHPNLRQEYLEIYKSKFLDFCKAKRIMPDLERVFGYRRVSSGL